MDSRRISPDFNRATKGLVSVEGALFGARFQGYVPENYGLRGKAAEEQFIILARSLDYSVMDFICEISCNRKAVYLNSSFWSQHDFSAAGIDAKRKQNVLDRRREAWMRDLAQIPLPATH